MANEDLIAQINQLNAEIAAIQAQINEANALAAQYKREADAAEAARHAAEEDRIRIENKLAGLAVSVEERLLLQREMVELKAQSVLAAAEMMVNDLRSAAWKRFGALTEQLLKLAARLDLIRDPTTGRRQGIEEIVINLFELHRENALTAEEYDALELPAAGYDEQMLCAIDYDLLAKLLLMAYAGPLGPITAEEYDMLELEAEAFEAFGLSCARFDLAARVLLGAG